jgi:hypothetical protein
MHPANQSNVLIAGNRMRFDRQWIPPQTRSSPFNAERLVFEDACWNGQWDVDGHSLNSISEWGNLQPVRTAVRDDVVSIYIRDAVP